MIFSLKEVLLQHVQNVIKHYEHDLTGEIGVYACNVDIGTSFSYRENTLFPMASTRKIAIAACFLQMVDQGWIDLQQKVTLYPEDWRPGSGLLNKRLVYSGAALPWSTFLQLMLEQSDNVATDIITEKIGGPQAITSWLRINGIQRMRLDRDSLRIKMDYDGIAIEAENLVNHECLERVYTHYKNSVTQTALDEARKQFLKDPQDTTTPKDMAILLDKICSSTLLSPSSRASLLQHMRLNQLSSNRISGLIPCAVDIAHKGGTLGERSYAITNDVAFLSTATNSASGASPTGKSTHIIISVFITSEKSLLLDRETAIANIARLLFWALQLIEGS